MKSKGFTLIELLITISILAILAVVGVTIYSGVTKNAKDSAKKADVTAIAKAYEVKYSNTGSYQTLADTDFSSGTPSLMESNAFNCIAGPGCTTDTTSQFAICVNLDNDSPCSTPSATCICKSSTQGASFTSLSGGSNPSCDPYGTLNSGLVGYWKMDEPISGPGSWNGTSSEVKDSSSSINHGTAINGTSTTGGQSNFGNTAVFDGVNDYISIPKSDSWMFYQNDFTISAWVYQTQNYSYFLGDYPHAGRNGVFFIGNSSNAPYSINFQGNDANGIYAYASFGASLPQNQWNNLLVTRVNNTSVSLYLDGQFKSNRTLNGTGNFNWSGYTRFAIGAPDGGPFFQGKMDDVRIYNRALSEPEITTLAGGCI